MYVRTYIRTYIHTYIHTYICTYVLGRGGLKIFQKGGEPKKGALYEKEGINTLCELCILLKIFFFVTQERSRIGPAINIFLNHKLPCSIFLLFILLLICRLPHVVNIRFFLSSFFYLIHTKRIYFITKVINAMSNVHLNNKIECAVL